jgi:hypothetical protein
LEQKHLRIEIPGLFSKFNQSKEFKPTHEEILLHTVVLIIQFESGALERIPAGHHSSKKYKRKS